MSQKGYPVVRSIIHKKNQVCFRTPDFPQTNKTKQILYNFLISFNEYVKNMPNFKPFKIQGIYYAQQFRQPHIGEFEESISQNWEDFQSR